MTEQQKQFLTDCCADLIDVAVSDGAFSPGPAIWVGRREVAHFDRSNALDVRLTKPLIAKERPELRADHRVTLRRGTSDWIEITIDAAADQSWAKRVVRRAIEANRSTAPSGSPPTGAQLERRRRFH